MIRKKVGGETASGNSDFCWASRPLLQVHFHRLHRRISKELRQKPLENLLWSLMETSPYQMKPIALPIWPDPGIPNLCPQKSHICQQCLHPHRPDAQLATRIHFQVVGQAGNKTTSSLKIFWVQAPPSSQLCSCLQCMKRQSRCNFWLLARLGALWLSIKFEV